MNDGLYAKAILRNVLNRYQEQLDTSELVCNWMEGLGYCPLNAEAVLMHAFHGWLMTVCQGSEGHIRHGLIDPRYWHMPPYDGVVLALLTQGFLATDNLGFALGLTPKGLWAVLHGKSYIAELEDYPPERLEQALNLLLRVNLSRNNVQKVR